MTFDKILDDGRLWAVRYDEKEKNCFEELFGQWYDMQWLRSFFKENLNDLEAYFHITDVYKAVLETIEEGVYVVTGGAIKLTATMSERSHTLAELAKLELVRNHFIDKGIYDKNGINDYFENEQSN